MPIDFHLSQAQDGIRKATAGFAAGPFKKAKKTDMKYQHHQESFQLTQPLYHQAVAGGLIKGQIPTHLGGSGGSLIAAAILVEEMYTVEPAASLTIFSTGLGLMPINLTGKPEHKEFLLPFLSGEDEPFASVVFSEQGGSYQLLRKRCSGALHDFNVRGRRAGAQWREGRNNTFLQAFLCSSSKPPLRPTRLMKSVDLGYQQRWLGLRRRRPPMRRLPDYDLCLLRPCQRNHNSPRHRR